MASLSRFYFGAAVVTLSTIWASTSHAQGTDATGVYKGTAIETIECGGLGSGVRKLKTTLSVDGSSDGSFTANTFFNGTEVFNGVTQPFVNNAAPLVGTVSSGGAIAADYQSSPLINTTGSLSENTWKLRYISVSGPCTFVLKMVVVRNSLIPADAPSALITGAATLLSSTRAISSLQQTRIGSLFANRGTGASSTSGGFVVQGAAAGEGDTLPIGIWASYSRSKSKNNFVSTANLAKRYTILGGIDLMPTDWIITGLALGYEATDVDTRFNAGAQKTDGYTISPYAAMLLSDRLTLDASVGMSSLRTEQHRTSIAPLGARSRVESGFRSLRRFITANASYGFDFGNLRANANVGYLWAKESQHDYVESDGTRVARFGFTLSQLLLGGDVSYQFGNIEPYARVTYERDISVTEVNIAGGFAQPKNDSDGFITGMGVRYFINQDFTAQMEVQSIIGRANLSEHLWSLMIRGTF